MKRFLLLLVVALSVMGLIGCYYMEPVRISVANDPTALQSSDSMVWRSDPTRVIFRNYSNNIYVRIWVGRNPVGAPDLELAPEESWPFNFPGLGVHAIYIAGREATVSGWENLGVKKRPIEISSFYLFGSVREIPVGDWDFAEYYRLPNRWHR